MRNLTSRSIPNIETLPGNTIAEGNPLSERKSLKAVVLEANGDI